MTQDQNAALRLLRDYPAEYGRMLGYIDLKDELHGKWIQEMVTGKGDITLLAHRGSYKTTAVAIALTMLLFLRGDLNCMFIRKTDNDIREVVRQVIRNLRHPVTQALFRAIHGKELSLLKATDSEITTSVYSAPRGASQLLGIGIGGSLTGKHADVLFTDDIVNLNDRISHSEREQTKAIYQELQNIRNKGGRIINTGTPWHKEDAFTLMPEPQKFDCYSTGILTAEQIEEKRQSMAPSLFAANYELRHIAVENALFTTSPVYCDSPGMFRDGIAHIDAAYGGEDYTAFTCAKRDGDTLYMYGRMWHRHVDTVLDVCISEAERLQCAPIWCEDNADKKFLAMEINKRYKAASYHEKENKYLKISSYLRKWWPNIIWLKGTDPEYIAQIMDYTEDAAHDDAPDSASVMCRYWDRRSGTPYKSSLFGG